MELKLSGRIAEDLALERHRELLERGLRQARLGKGRARKRGWGVRVWHYMRRQLAHATEG